MYEIYSLPKDITTCTWNKHKSNIDGKGCKEVWDKRVLLSKRMMAMSNHPCTPFPLLVLWYHGPIIASSRNIFGGDYSLIYFV